MKSLFILTLFLIFNSTSVYPQWTEMSGPNQLLVFSVSGSGSNLFAGTKHSGVYLSSNLGVTWTQWKHGFDQIRDFAITNNYSFVTSSNEGLYRSDNNGENWTRSIPYNVDGLSVACLGSTIALGTYKTVFLSFNNGSNWTTTSYLNNAATDMLLTDGYIFVATPVRGIYYSTNNGSDWLQGELNNQSVNALDKFGEKLFAGTDTNGIFESSDYGLTWVQTTMDTQEVLTINHQNSNIFAGTGSEGVYYSSNGGKTWNQINEGLLNLKVYKLTILGNYIFAATNGPNVWRRPLSEIIGVKNISTSVPDNFKLHQNYPNPFNPSTKINFKIPSSQFVSIKVYNILGIEVAILANEFLNAGGYQVEFNGNNFDSGIYFYKIQTENFTDTKSMIMLK